MDTVEDKMKRRNFLKSMLAVPVVGLAAKGKTVTKTTQPKPEKHEKHKYSEKIVDLGLNGAGELSLWLGIRGSIRGRVEMIASKESDFSNSKVVGGGVIKNRKAHYFRIDCSDSLRRYLRVKYTKTKGATIKGGDVAVWLGISPEEPIKPSGFLQSTLDFGGFV